MNILGIHDGHNATAALFRDGTIVACASEERFTRVKNDTGYPWKAVDYVLSAASVKPGQIDKVALATNSQDPVLIKLKRASAFKVPDYIKEMHEYWKPLLIENRRTDFWQRLLDDPRFASNNSYYNIDYIKRLPEQRWKDEFNKERLRLIVEQLQIPEDRIHMIDHHTGHAYYAYFASPRSHTGKAAVVTADGFGDGCNATISIAEKGGLTEIHRTDMCNMARMYRWATLLLGMKPNEHEYKVMGLAPYAKDYIREPAYKVYKETLVVDGLDFRWNIKPSDMYFYFQEKFEGIRFDGIAAGLQLWLEEMLTEWIENIMTVTKAEVLYYSGGLSMNVKANKIIAELPAVKDFYVPPSGADESLAIGAALVLAAETGEAPAPLKDAYLGSAPSKDDAAAFAQPFRSNKDYKVIDDPDADLVAAYLCKGKVLGRCVGRMEFGARSLGNRAILCDPSKHENLRLINEKIKFRDFWMPFTPSILAERADDYIVNPKRLMAEYMTIAFESTPLARKHLKAAIHPYDFTVRPQLVSPAVNNDYYCLIKAFEKRTGIGGILNTSLNLHGYPIVATARDAADVLQGSGLDGMLFRDILIMKRDRSARHNRRP